MYLGSDLTIHKHRHHQPPKKRELHFIFLANAGSASVEKFQIERKNYCDSLKDFPLRWVVSSVYTCDLSDEHHLLAFHLHSLQERLCGSCNTDVQGFSELIHSFRVMLEKWSCNYTATRNLGPLPDFNFRGKVISQTLTQPKSESLTERLTGEGARVSSGDVYASKEQTEILGDCHLVS